MQINNANTGYEGNLEKPQAQSLPMTRRVDQYLQSYEASYQRMARVREKVIEQQAHSHPEPHVLDRALAHPERFKNPVLRALIHIAKITEELAESITDISGLTERLTRNLISSGEKADLALVIGSAAGRVVSGQLSWLGFALHKAIGASLYGISSVASVAALSLSRTRFGELQQIDRVEKKDNQSVFDKSMYEVISNKLLSIKHGLIKRLVGSVNQQGKIGKWACYMRRNKNTDRQKSATKRRANCNYMWNNLHQYGATTKALMHLAYGVFQIVNKLGVSYDKHVGTFLSRKLLSKKMGELMGTRLAMTLTVAAAAALSVPLAPMTVGLSSIGAIACGVALLALLAAKANVKYNFDWNGDIQPQKPRTRFSVA